MPAISKLKPGQVLYDVSRVCMGNTAARTIAVRLVHVVEVHDDHIVASWNSNSPREYSEHQVKHWKVQKPSVVKSTYGFGMRLATRDEIQVAKLNGTAQESISYISVPRFVDTTL